MWRAGFATAIAWCALTIAAEACIGTNYHRGVIFDAIPDNAPEDAIVLRVEFDDAEVERIAGPHATANNGNTWLVMQRTTMEARVTEVVQGNYSSPTVRVAIGGTSCDAPFIFGTSGLVVGRLTTPVEGQSRYDAARPLLNGERLIWPYTETIFEPLSDTPEHRRERTGGQ